MGETIRHATQGDEVLRWEYLVITPRGMTWGRLNGMRPRAVVLFAGKLDGDTLAGTSRFGGLTLDGSDEAPPPLHFSFTRR